MYQISVYKSARAFHCGILATGMVTSSSWAYGQDHSMHGMADSKPAAMEHEDTMGLMIPMQREGSGTSWLPDSTPMHAIHGKWNDWDLMLHSQLFVQYISQGGPRGEEQFGSINWVMGMMEREVGAGKLGLRTMLSAEPWTVGECGFPDLLQTGESCNGQKIHDRQHPHDLFMELAATYSVPLGDSLGLVLYGGPAAEPALGPVAFPHRPSAFPGPLAPISHHWLDATHISFGVATLGIFGSTWKLEGSAFNGREPDENRTDFDTDTMDSYSGRISLMPNKDTVIQLSGGYLKEAEPAEEDGAMARDVRRYSASLIHNRALSGGGIMASTLAFGQNQEQGQESSAILAESSLTLQPQDTISVRAEWVQKRHMTSS